MNAMGLFLLYCSTFRLPNAFAHIDAEMEKQSAEESRLVRMQSLDQGSDAWWV